MTEKIFKKVGSRDLVFQEKCEVKDLEKTYCPCCGGGPLDGATGVAENSDTRSIPEDGDPTICVFCGEILRYTIKNGVVGVEIPNEEYFKALRLSDVWSVIQQVSAQFKEMALQARLRGDMKYARSKPKRF